MPVSICIYSNVVKQGQFFLFHNVQRILLKDFWIFYPKCTLNSADFFPIFVYWIMRQNSHFTVPLPYTMLCCLCNVCCYCTRLLSYSCCFITKVTIGLFHRVLMLSPLLSVPYCCRPYWYSDVWCCCCHWFLSCSHLYSCRIWLSLLLFIALVSATVIAFVTGLNVGCIY